MKAICDFYIGNRINGFMMNSGHPVLKKSYFGQNAHKKLMFLPVVQSLWVVLFLRKDEKRLMFLHAILNSF